MHDKSISPEALGKKLQQSERNLRLLVNGVKDYAIFMLDPDGYILTWNEGAQRIKGYSAEEIIGKHFSAFYDEESNRAEHPQKELLFAHEHGVYEEEGWRLRKDGTKFWANVVITALFDENNELAGFAKVTRDLTERRNAAQQREADARLLAQTNAELKQALAVKNRFLSTMSHEVRTPMAAVIGMTEILTLQDLGADNNSIIQNIFQSCKRLLQMLNNVLDVARMQSGKLSLEYRLFPIRSILGDVRQLISSEGLKKNLALVGYCDPRIPEYILGDEVRIRQVLLNLAFNAVKFTHSGEVAITCSFKEGSQDVLRISVRDTGIGIKTGDQHRLFEPFSQAEDSTSSVYGGTGLGLSISKELIELMGGEIGVQSEFGKGSTFWFDVPINTNKCQ